VLTPAATQRLSRRTDGIPEALSIWMNQIVADLRRQGDDLTVLSLGEAFFDIPWLPVDPRDAERGNHYSDSRGVAELREKLARYYGTQYGAPVDPATDLLVTAGSKIAIYLVMLALLDPGDEVVIQEPAWLSYQEHARLVGAVPRFVPYDVPLEQLGDWLTPRTRLVVLNNPNNPAGRNLPADELRAAYEACRAHGSELLVDEAYSDFVSGERFTSLAALVPNREGAIVVNSVSKNLGVSGWRIGYLIAHPTLVDACLKLNQHLITCAPTFLQLHLARHFDDLLAVTLPQAQAIAVKRARIASAIDRLGLERLPGAATFYFFVSIGAYEGSSLDFATELLLDDKIAVVPGSAYGASTERFVRLSIGTESEERIVAALEMMRRRAASPRGSISPEERLRARGVRPFAPVAR
jgi:aspartate aminotransferase/aminotransferase